MRLAEPAAPGRDSTKPLSMPAPRVPLNNNPDQQRTRSRWHASCLGVDALPLRASSQYSGRLTAALFLPRRRHLALVWKWHRSRRASYHAVSLSRSILPRRMFLFKNPFAELGRSSLRNPGNADPRLTAFTLIGALHLGGCRSSPCPGGLPSHTRQNGLRHSASASALVQRTSRRSRSLSVINSLRLRARRRHSAMISRALASVARIHDPRTGIRCSGLGQAPEIAAATLLPREGR